MTFCYKVEIEVSISGKDPYIHYEYMFYERANEPSEIVVKMDALEQMKDKNGIKNAKHVHPITVEEFKEQLFKNNITEDIN